MRELSGALDKLCVEGVCNVARIDVLSCAWVKLNDVVVVSVVRPF